MGIEKEWHIVLILSINNLILVVYRKLIIQEVMPHQEKVLSEWKEQESKPIMSIWNAKRPPYLGVSKPCPLSYCYQRGRACSLWGLHPINTTDSMRDSGRHKNVFLICG